MLTLELSYIAHSSWLTFFLYDGDALTLPLFRESIARHEQLVPALSTQLLVFPEGGIYAFCSALTTSIRSSLVLNAYVNILLLYAAVRALAPAVVRQAGRRGPAAAVFCTSLIGLMLLERQTPGHNLQFATLNLLTTYYFGVILGGLIVLVATLGHLRAGTMSTRRPVGWVALAVAISTLTYFSDPLFLLWVTVPLSLSVLVLAILRRIPWQKAAVIFGGQVCSLIFGTALRRPFKDDVGSSASSYVDFGRLGAALRTFGGMVGRMWTLPSERIELIVLGIVLAVALYQFVDLWRRPEGSCGGQPGAAFLVVTFSLIAPFTDLLGVLASGNSTSRYFIPVFVFSLLALIPLLGRVPDLRWHGVPSFTGAAVAGVALLGIVTIAPRLEPLLSPAQFPGVRCLQTAVGGKPTTGIGDFWTARALDVYSTGGIRVLQVLPNLEPFAWLTNIGEYEHRDVRFVIVDRRKPAPTVLTARDTTALGKPTKITACPGFYVYFYGSHTTGLRTMNDTISTWLASTLRARR